MAAALVALAPCAHAAPEATTANGACEHAAFKAREPAALADRNGTIAAFERLPEACLKRVLIACHREAGRRLLDLGSAAMCSMNYEALLRKSFGGDFNALMAWWQREGALASAADER